MVYVYGQMVGEVATKFPKPFCFTRLDFDTRGFIVKLKDLWDRYLRVGRKVKRISICQVL